jgi:hypothetical protein
MAKKSTGVYVVDKFNNPYELNEYHLFVQKECAKLKKKGIHIPGSGNTLVYIGELWQKQKAKEAPATYNYAAVQQAEIKRKLKIEQEAEKARLEAEAKKKEEAAAKRKLAKQKKDAEKLIKDAADFGLFVRDAKLDKASSVNFIQEAASVKEDERRYNVIQHSNTIISTFNINNTSYFSNNPSTKRFIGVQV